ncbi:uncharacterized protein MONOS_9187 [Monocercomonoides exilis]|uniref:uncharacterized protein n=1 Tax=Monocercomonoides exilis TaxID=2049356 RepID=UPI003559B4D1|nr:hypothetical protein MONOS_9187 [Monocercomonoides exilis]|eukprot:MONOS_9187.1-p1 / transcript=MONOS_9187.1 / gene=MONOS_9187 / organism=Monocercomonoides_exilis_PA203 / gene_product=unspecified product / transcript_product=unspecified product / location=Mono_scaffold00370:42951-44184(+) / protein_length=279 / sequence_SO=supercontig / SO=protein_coding / is_pseudo=false
MRKATEDEEEANDDCNGVKSAGEEKRRMNKCICDRAEFENEYDEEVDDDDDDEEKEENDKDKEEGEEEDLKLHRILSTKISLTSIQANRQIFKKYRSVFEYETTATFNSGKIRENSSVETTFNSVEMKERLKKEAVTKLKMNILKLTHGRIIPTIKPADLLLPTNLVQEEEIKSKTQKRKMWLRGKGKNMFYLIRNEERRERISGEGAADTDEAKEDSENDDSDDDNSDVSDDEDSLDISRSADTSNADETDKTTEREEDSYTRPALRFPHIQPKMLS